MRAALDPNGADAYWAGRFGLIPLYDPPQTTKAPSCAALDVCGLLGSRVAFFV